MSRGLKRAGDVVVAGLLLVVTAPAQAVVAAAVWRDLGTPVLFRQSRPGLHGDPFTLVKFRTMTDRSADRPDDADRLTPLGAWLRRTSLDELPTLWNVLVGDMSLVGPRPLLMAYLGVFSSAQQRRHEVRPGVTGLAQVSGRNELPWAARLALDVHYVDHRSSRLDLAILARTLPVVLGRRGIAAPGAATMPLFSGGAP